MAIRPRREQGRQLAPETTLPQPGGVPHGKGHDLLPFRQFAVPETESAGGGRSEKLRVHTLPQYGNEPAHPFGVLLPLPFRRRKMAVTIKKVFRLQRVADIAGGQGDVGHGAERIASLDLIPKIPVGIPDKESFREQIPHKQTVAHRTRKDHHVGLKPFRKHAHERRSRGPAAQIGHGPIPFPGVKGGGRYRCHSLLPVLGLLQKNPLDAREREIPPPVLRREQHLVARQCGQRGGHRPQRSGKSIIQKEDTHRPFGHPPGLRGIVDPGGCVYVTARFPE